MPTMFSLRLLSVLVTAQKSPAGNDSSHSSMLWATISAAVSAACLTTSQVEVLRRLAYGRWFVPTAISGAIAALVPGLGWENLVRLLGTFWRHISITKEGLHSS